MSEFFIPRSVGEAVELAAAHGDELLVMGGGTVVMSLVNDGTIFPQKVMSLARAGMSGVKRINSHIEIGATTTVSTITGLIGFPLLATAASKVAAPAVRNAATIGGNLYTPPPYGDLAPALLAYDAEVVMISKSGERTLPLDVFYRQDNCPDELMSHIGVPKQPGKTAFLKYGRRVANTPSIVSVAVRVVVDGGGVCTEARIALGAVAPSPIRAHHAEAALIGQVFGSDSIAAAAEAAMNECDPVTDALATDWYRRKMVRVFVKRALEGASDKGQSAS